MSDLERPASDGASSDSPPGDATDEGRTPGAAGQASPESEDVALTQEPRKPEKRKGSGSGGSFLRELPVLLLIAFVLAFLLRTFVVQVFYIPSSSMEPTLQINDRMVVEKVSYHFREPRRGEIAVFEGDDLGSLPDNGVVGRAVRGVGQFIGIVPASARDFVKRVIGLPGDEVLIEGGQVFVNGEPIDEPYVVYDDESDFGPVTVPEGRLFFLGDNRPNSSDSRRSLGFVEADQVVGRASVVIWPFDHFGLLTGTVHEVPDRGAPRESDDAAGTGDSDAGSESSEQEETGDAGSESSEGAGTGDADDASAREPEPQPAF